MADTPNEKTVIGSDAHIKGEISFQKSVRLVGTLEGSIKGDGELHIAQGAACKADVDSKAVQVDGIVEGNLLAREVVQLNASGVVKGDIVAGKMVMAEGASFFGQCAVGPEAVKGGAAKAAKAAATPGSPGAQAGAQAGAAGAAGGGKPEGKHDGGRGR